MTDLGRRVHLLIRAEGSTVATAESLTGGRLAVRFTDVPGVSETYLGGAVTYATPLKASMLGVDAEIIDEFGVISSQCAEAMASGVRATTGATYGLSTTGVAGPDDQEGKPAGTVYVGLAGPGFVTSQLLELDGDRTDIQEATCDAVLAALEERLREHTALR
ncbi:nicotinamide-nucleotide amidase [Nocardioides terrae]|uniref:Nicotinamide-nucleotide amidase n=1 Tax=Nocardioides terrae TaxID=574651 RepID=A0A1I1JWJ3_9ACTN|nr:CinA family protein [Nocardioides terrae]SFC52886.1 nicotinamide-nucleotide amidase [Nocardioides terrae]